VVIEVEPCERARRCSQDGATRDKALWKSVVRRVDAGLVAFFLERVFSLGIESDSGEARTRLVPELRVRGGMHGGTSRTPSGEVGTRTDENERQELSGKMKIFTAP
jgi:hypothetical protein